MANPVLAAHSRRLGVEPGQGRAKAAERHQGSRGCQPVAARDVELAIEDDARGAASADAGDTLAGGMQLGNARSVAARKDAELRADDDLDARHPAPQHL